MPLYFFHLSFGERIVPDDEGIELPSRSAAREEALAAVRALSDKTSEQNSRRWAGWFLEVADAEGAFLRCPIGMPALEVVPRGGRQDFDLPLTRRFAVMAARTEHELAETLGENAGRALEVARQVLARMKKTAQLLERNRELREDLFAHFAASEQIRVHAREIVVRAKLVSAQGGDYAWSAPTKSSQSRPQLILLQGDR